MTYRNLDNLGVQRVRPRTSLRALHGGISSQFSRPQRCVGVSTNHVNGMPRLELGNLVAIDQHTGERHVTLAVRRERREKPERIAVGSTQQPITKIKQEIIRTF